MNISGRFILGCKNTNAIKTYYDKRNTSIIHTLYSLPPLSIPDCPPLGLFYSTTMRRVKTYLRSTMKSSRLSSLTLLSIDFENSDKLLKDPTAVLEVFASMKNRRIQFQI